MKLAKWVLLILSPISLLGGIFNIGYSFSTVSFDTGHAAFGLVILLIGVLGFGMGLII